MSLLIISFIAGVLTVLAPCILPVLPIVIGGSVSDHEKRSPLVITLSLAVSVVLFTLLLKFSTVFIDIPPQTWQIVSGSIIIIFGLVSLFPGLWEAVAGKLNFSPGSGKLLAKAAGHKNRYGDVLIGAALGPVFSSCSPTYFVILASVLPQSFATGLVYLIAYAAGLSLILFIIGYYGQRAVKRMQWAADPHGWFKRGLGVLFIVVGLLVFTGKGKEFQTYLLSKGFFDITKLEVQLLDKFDMEKPQR